MTITAKINKNNPESEIILKAAEIIKNGGLVAFPTETVYGLGADALNPEAVKKIYLAKGRPSDNPLILHVENINQVYDLVEVNETAEILMKKFWPAPLTLVMKAKNIIPSITRGGLETAAIRMPNNLVALALIKAAGTPIAAPSANLSGRPSPTDFESVFNDMNGKIEMILDGGSVDVGIESTVIDITNPKKFLMLRPGGMNRKILEETLNSRLEIPDSNSKKRSPGTRYRHYAPNIPVLIWKNGEKFPEKNNAAYIGLHEPEVKNINLREKIIFKTVKDFAKELFAAFRKFERENFSCVIVEWPEGDFINEENEISEGLRDRIERASRN
ncbi:MAG: threonylcarbamoyl-AMP synthase [Synergistaceae bacterium]|nr:threonylcarbamoyl-AMP synthase [Synergistaceae bacterium]